MRLFEIVDFQQHIGAQSYVRVNISNVKGSTPREAGAFMLVGASIFRGTIGGGALEYSAIDQARLMLKNQDNYASLNIPLGPEIGQCCGGHVTLDFERLEQDDLNVLIDQTRKKEANLPQIWLFGAGHVGRALAASLSPLPVHVKMIDTRHQDLALLPDNIDKILTAIPESFVPSIPSGSAVLVLTHDHALDFMICNAAIKRSDLCYIGMIGSQTKRTVYDRQFVRDGGDKNQLSRLISPIGYSCRKPSQYNKRPEVIAAMVTHELIEYGILDQRFLSTQATKATMKNNKNIHNKETSHV